MIACHTKMAQNDKATFAKQRHIAFRQLIFVFANMKHVRVFQ